MAIKGQILNFKQAFLLTEKGKEYQAKKVDQTIENIEMVEVNGVFAKKVIIFWSDEYQFTADHLQDMIDQLNNTIIEDSIWRKPFWYR
jgi:6-phosphogluconolactonase/glucosamine-6-phosphate isomerase/deaminase